MKDPRWDVVIYEIATRKIESIAGKEMISIYDKDGGSERNTAEMRLATVLGRCNSYYTAEMVPAGVYSKGQKLPENP